MHTYRIYLQAFHLVLWTSISSPPFRSYQNGNRKNKMQSNPIQSIEFRWHSIKTVEFRCYHIHTHTLSPTPPIELAFFVISFTQSPSSSSALSHLYGLQSVCTTNLSQGWNTPISMRAALAENSSSMQIANIQEMLRMCFVLVGFFFSSQSNGNVENKKWLETIEYNWFNARAWQCACARALSVNVMWLSY